MGSPLGSDLNDGQVVVVAGETAVIADVFCRINSGKCPEIVNEVRLVKVAAVQRDVAPIDGSPAANLFQHGLESSHAAKNFRCHSYVLLEQFDEAPRAEAGFVHYLRNPGSRRSRQKFPHRILDHWQPSNMPAARSRSATSTTRSFSAEVGAASTRSRSSPASRPHKSSNPTCWLCSSSLGDRKSTRLNSSHDQISYAVFCLKKKKKTI